MTRLLLLAAFALAASSCGGRTSISCNNTAAFACSTSSVSAGLVLTSPSCPSPSVEISSCPTAGIIGTCTVTTAITTPTTGTATQVASVYTGGDATAAQTACTSAGGTWTTP